MWAWYIISRIIMGNTSVGLCICSTHLVCIPCGLWFTECVKCLMKRIHSNQLFNRENRNFFGYHLITFPQNRIIIKYLYWTSSVSSALRTNPTKNHPLAKIQFANGKRYYRSILISTFGIGGQTHKTQSAIWILFLVSFVE